MEYHIYKTVRNTNETIKYINTNFNQNFSNLALFSQHQTHGRGRGENVWLSKKGDFTSSFLFNKKFKSHMLGQINILIVHGLIKLLEEKMIGLDLKFKWPNDIYFNEMKLAGILTETTIQKKEINSLIIGIGINFISCPIFNNKKSARMIDFSTKSTPLNMFFTLSEVFENYFNNFINQDFLKLSKELSSKMLKKNEIITVKQNNKTFKGEFIRIDKYGAIVIQTTNGCINFSYGETL